jgi:hypothetical protein
MNSNIHSNLEHNINKSSMNTDIHSNLVIDNIFNYGKNNFNNHIIDDIGGFDDSNYESF